MTADVPAVIAAAKLDEAFKTFVLAVVTLVPTAASVAPRDVEAAFVFALIAVCEAVIAEANELEAEVTSD